MRYRWLLGGCFLGALLFVIWPFAAWQIKEETQLDVAVIDKTVPVENYREHGGLFWIMENMKIMRPDGGAYRPALDYYGNHPEQGAADRNLSFARGPDLVYVADTYGVYQADLGEGRRTGERSELLYGGLTSYEWDQIMQAKSRGALLIMEFNSIASPTAESVRHAVERAMGFQWTGWIGRYFPNLQSEEVPQWVKTNYVSQTGEPWAKQGSGIVFVDEGDKVVLLDSKDSDGQVHFTFTDEGRGRYPGAEDSEYGYWFDVMLPGEDLSIDAVYHLNLTESGEEKLASHGIPLQFPAVMRHAAQGHYYFAGDYSDLNIGYFARWAPSKLFLRIMAVIRKEEQFFWLSYVPMMQEILHQTRNEALTRESESGP